MRDLDQLLRQHADDNTPGEVPDFGIVLERARREEAGLPHAHGGRGGASHREAGPVTTARGRRGLLVAAAAGAVTVGGWGAAWLLADDTGESPVARPPVERSGPLPEGGAASCAFEPTEENLARRAFAFDGTVAAIDGPAAVADEGDDLGYAQVTFDVVEWYVGGDDRQVVVQMTPPVGLSTDVTAEGGPSYEVGTRLLVSGEPRWGGDDPLADAVGWGCGFTVYWDAQTAQTWGRVFDG